MKNVFLFSGLMMACIMKLCAQPGSYTLQQCIDSALARNVQVRQTGLVAESSEIYMKQARANLLPNLNASLDNGINQGRSIDPFTNTYVNQSVNYAGYGINTGVVVFSGMNLRNTIRQTTLAYDASKMELEQAKDNLTLSVILAYLQVLNNEDLLASSQKQKELSAKQLERLSVLDSQGAIPPSQVSDLKGQLLNDELSILNLKNALETSKLSLSQLMNIPYNPAMRLERVRISQSMVPYNKTSGEVFQTALREFSLVKAVELRRRSAVYAVKAARGLMYPSLVVGVGAQTNYSSIAQNNLGKIRYNDQLRNNVFSSFNVGLRIPIFNGFIGKNNVRLANIGVRNAELVEENTTVQLRQQIEQATLNVSNAYARYRTLVEQVAAYDLSFKAADARFNAGVGTSVDYLIAKNNLDRATITLIIAQYEYVLRIKVLDYYQNIRSN